MVPGYAPRPGPARRKTGRRPFFRGINPNLSRANQNRAPGKDLVLKFTILSQLPDSEKKTVLSTTLWRVVGVVPGGAQKSSGGWCEGSNPPQGVPGDHSWLTLGGSMTWWADSTMEHACATFACELIHSGTKIIST